MLCMGCMSAFAQFPGGMPGGAPAGGMPPMGQFGFGGQQIESEDAAWGKKYTDINYVGDGEEYHNLDIYLPKEEKEKYPVVVHIYGSAWFSNSSKGMADINTICSALLNAGYAVVCPNHRSSMDAKWPAQINDIKAVVRFLRAKSEKFHLDPDFIGVSGFSSGAHLASVMATTNGLTTVKQGEVEYDLEGKLGIYTNERSYVNACCEWSGPVDLLHMDCDGVEKNPMSPEVAVMGMPKEGNTDAYMLLCAPTFIDSRDVPIGIFHGMKDNVVPECQGSLFHQQLQAAGVKTFLVEEPEGGHGFNMYSEENLQKMVKWFDEARLLPKSAVLEDGGTGQYPAVMTEEESLPAHTIFAPKDLTPFGKKNLLPVLVWGNGACVNSPFEHLLFLNEIASQGYLVVATGYFPIPGQNYWGLPRSSADQQLEAIDWVIARNEDKNSPYYHKIDVKSICVSGMSCGGLQTLHNSADPRIKTLMICNSGLFNNPMGAVPGMPMPDKSKLDEIKVPIIYILGGKEDIAYENGMDDFHRIQHVPAMAVNLPVGHGGTYGQPHGGEFTVPAIGWLNWQLKGDKEAAKLFQGDACGMSQREGWTAEKNALIDAKKK